MAEDVVPLLGATEGPGHPGAGLQLLCCWRTGVGADPVHTTPSTAVGLGEELLTHHVLGWLVHSAVPPRQGQQLQGQRLAVWGPNHTESLCCNSFFPNSFWPVDKMHLSVSWQRTACCQKCISQKPAAPHLYFCRAPGETTQ